MNRGLNAFAPWAALLIAIMSAVYSFGVQANRIDNLESKVSDMSAETRSQAKTLDEIKDTTTVIRTKLEILLPTGNPKDVRH